MADEVVDYRPRSNKPPVPMLEGIADSFRDWVALLDKIKEGLVDVDKVVSAGEDYVRGLQNSSLLATDVARAAEVVVGRQRQELSALLLKTEEAIKMSATMRPTDITKEAVVLPRALGPHNKRAAVANE